MAVPLSCPTFFLLVVSLAFLPLALPKAVPSISEVPQRTPLTIKLKRQRIPLHSKSGVVQHKGAYYGSISLGGPEQQMMEVVFDTGSGHVVVPAAVCRTESCVKHRRYRRKASVFAEDVEADGSLVAPGRMRDQLTVSFGTGEVTGIFVRDYVCFGSPSELQNAPHEEMKRHGRTFMMPVDGCATMQTLYAIDMTDEPFAAFAFDGIVGLGLPGLSQTPDFNFFRAMSNAPSWRPRVGFEHAFTVFLAVSDEEDSEISFGSYESGRMKAPDAGFTWHDVMDSQLGYWQIHVAEVRADGRRIDFCDDGNCRGIVDTGTSILGVPYTVGPELMSNLRHAAPDTGACDGELPELEFTLPMPSGGNATVKLEPKDYARPEFLLDTNSQQEDEQQGLQEKPDVRGVSGLPVNAAVALKPGGMCLPMLMYLTLGDPLSEKTFLFGEPLLQRYYTVFDANPARPRIGFAEAHHSRPRAPLHIFT